MGDCRLTEEQHNCLFDEEKFKGLPRASQLLLLAQFEADLDGDDIEDVIDLIYRSKKFQKGTAMEEREKLMYRIV